MMKRFDPIFIFLSILLVWKAFFLFTQNALSEEEAIVGKVAQQILNGNGSLLLDHFNLKVLLSVGLFSCFGPKEFILLLLPPLFYVGFVVSLYWLLTLIANQKAARITLLLALLNPYGFTLFSNELLHIEILFYGNLFFISLVKLTSRSKQKKRNLALGLMATLAFAFLMESLSLKFSEFSAPDFSLIFIRFYSFFSNTLTDLIRGSKEIFFIALFLISLFWFVRQKGWHFRNSYFPLFLIFIFSLIVFCWDPLPGLSRISRLSLLLLFPAFLGLYLAALSQKTKILFWAILLTFFSLQGWESYSSGEKRVQMAFDANQNQNHLLKLLRSKNVAHVYISNSMNNALFFRSEGEIQLELLPQKFLSKTKRVESVAAATQPGFIFSKGEESTLFEKNLSQLGCQFKKQETLNHSLYFDIVRTQKLGEEILPADWVGPKEAFDRDITTRWSTHHPQRPGEQFEVKLPNEVTLSGLELRTAFDSDLPRQLKVEISLDGKSWKEICSLPIYSTPLHWSGTHPFVASEQGRIEMAFPPTRGRFVRLTQMGEAKRYYWSIHELYLYKESSPRKSKEKQRQGLP